MGSSTSKTVTYDTDAEEFSEKPSVAAVTTQLGDLSIDPTNTSSDITIEGLTSWETDLLSEPKNKLAQNALAKTPIADVIAASGLDVVSKLRHFYNVEVDVIGSPLYLDNQKLSGRCWIFATCNVLRAHVIRTYNLDPSSFQLSQSYLFFYDKLEKANYFLENVIDTVDEDLDSRLLGFLFSGSISDGGQWDMIVNVIQKYGVVPNEIFPDNAQSTSTSALNYFLGNKLREYALVLRKLIKSGASNSEVARAKNAMNKQIYSIIALTLGNPPKPEDKFTWDFKDKNGKSSSFQASPLSFYKDHVKYDVGKRFSLIHDPRNDYNKLYTVDRLNNVAGGKPIEYVNLTLPDIKKAAIRMLKANEPIFFGSDVGKFANTSTGILATEAYDYGVAFNTLMKLTKEERLRTGSSAMTHAMVITGVHLDASGGPVRWKIENSWGDAVGDLGYFMMTDAWFDEYVLQIVTSKQYVDKAVYEVWKSKDYLQLPFYDPMGALA